MPVYSVRPALRLKVKRTQQTKGQLATTLRMSASTVYRVLGGVQAPGPLFVERFLHAFPDVTFDEMFTIRY